MINCLKASKNNRNKCLAEMVLALSDKNIKTNIVSIIIGLSNVIETFIVTWKLKPHSYYINDKIIITRNRASYMAQWL